MRCLWDSLLLLIVSLQIYQLPQRLVHTEVASQGQKVCASLRRRGGGGGGRKKELEGLTAVLVPRQVLISRDFRHLAFCQPFVGQVGVLHSKDAAGEGGGMGREANQEGRRKGGGRERKGGGREEEGRRKGGADGKEA
eukprot:761973-Hanusia_phi.AAC.2